MKHFYFKFSKKTFIHLFLGLGLLLMSQGMMAQKTSAQSGAWTDGATWVGGVPPTTTELVTVAAGHAVTYPLTANAVIGALNVENTASLTISNNFTLNINSVAPSNIAGTLTITGTASSSINSITVASTGIISSTGTGSTSLNAAGTTWTNNGTITISTLGTGTLDTSRTVNNNWMY